MAKQQNDHVPPRGDPRRVEVQALRLDPANPRLPESHRARSQDDLVKLMAEDYSLTEIGRSLAENGYFEEEPIAVVRDKGETYLVIEGNRRVAALKLLGEPALRRRLDLGEWDELSSKIRFNLTKIPAIVYATSEDLLTFMGFRHITGVKQWEPLAKARFINSLIDEHRMGFVEAARRIGSKANAIRQQYLAYRVYLQARDQFDIDISRLERSYGVFIRAMNSAPLKEHIGISASKEKLETAAALAAPVPKTKGANLREFVSWIAGTDGEPAVISDSREITSLGEIVKAPAALSLLRVSRSLLAASQLVGGEETRLLDHLARASFHLDEALKDTHRHKSSERVQAMVLRCEETMAQIRSSLGR